MPEQTAREKLIEERAKYKVPNLDKLDADQRGWAIELATGEVDWFLQALSSLPDESLLLTDEELKAVIPERTTCQQKVFSCDECSGRCKDIAKAQFAKLASQGLGYLIPCPDCKATASSYDIIFCPTCRGTRKVFKRLEGK